MMHGPANVNLFFFLSLSRQLPEEYIKLDTDCLLTHLPIIQFIIVQSFDAVYFLLLIAYVNVLREDIIKVVAETVIKNFIFL
jgi:hypothetical protein